jgi:hypothetical protein
MGAFERLRSYKDYTANTNPTPRLAISRGAVATTPGVATREGDKSARSSPPDSETTDARMNQTHWCGAPECQPIATKVYAGGRLTPRTHRLASVGALAEGLLGRAGVLGQKRFVVPKPNSFFFFFFSFLFLFCKHSNSNSNSYFELPFSKCQN